MIEREGEMHRRERDEDTTNQSVPEMQTCQLCHDI